MSYAVGREGLTEAKEGREDPVAAEAVRKGPHVC